MDKNNRILNKLKNLYFAKKIFIYVYFASVLGIMIFLKMLPYSYLSYVNIIPKNTLQSGGLLSTVLNISQLNPGNNENLDYYLNAIVTSDSIVRTIFAKEYVIEGSYKSLYEILEVKYDSTNDYSKLKFENQVFNQFRKNNIYFLEDKSGLITIGIISQDPFLSKQIMDVLLLTISEYYDSYFLTKLLIEKTHVQKKMSELEKNLLKIENDLISFYKMNSEISASSSSKIVEDRLLREKNIVASVLLEMKKRDEALDFQILSNKNKLNIIETPGIETIPFKPKKKTIFFLSIFLVLFVLVLYDYYRKDISRIINKVFP